MNSLGEEGREEELNRGTAWTPALCCQREKHLLRMGSIEQAFCEHRSTFQGMESGPQCPSCEPHRPSNWLDIMISVSKDPIPWAAFLPFWFFFHQLLYKAYLFLARNDSPVTMAECFLFMGECIGVEEQEMKGISLRRSQNLCIRKDRGDFWYQLLVLQIGKLRLK